VAVRGSAAEVQELVFLLDVDNTLLDNDRVTADLRDFLEREIGPERAARYFAIFETHREELGYADYLGAVQQYRNENPRDPHVLAVSHFLIDYPFADRLYPEALEVIDRLKTWGGVVILSDGDVVFQPRKVERSGLWAAVDGSADLHTQGARAGRRARTISGAALRAGGRQAADPVRGEGSVGRAGDHGLSTPGTLCARPEGAGRLRTCGYQRGADW